MCKKHPNGAKSSRNPAECPAQHPAGSPAYILLLLLKRMTPKKKESYSGENGDSSRHQPQALPGQLGGEEQGKDEAKNDGGDRRNVGAAYPPLEEVPEGRRRS
jgi:hypothetical protein